MNLNITQEYATQISLVPNDLQTLCDQICRLLYTLIFSYFQIIYYQNNRNEDFFALGSLKHFKVINYDFFDKIRVQILTIKSARSNIKQYFEIFLVQYICQSQLKLLPAELTESVNEQ